MRGGRHAALLWPLPQAAFDTDRHPSSLSPPPPPPLAGVPPGQQHANAMAEAKRKWAQGGKAAAAKVFADVDAHLQKAGRAKL